MNPPGVARPCGASFPHDAHDSALDSVIVIWHVAVNNGDGATAAAACTEDVVLGDLTGEVAGRDVMRRWVESAQVRLTPRDCYDVPGGIVVAQDAAVPSGRRRPDHDLLHLRPPTSAPSRASTGSRASRRRARSGSPPGRPSASEATESASEARLSPTRPRGSASDLPRPVVGKTPGAPPRGGPRLRFPRSLTDVGNRS